MSEKWEKNDKLPVKKVPEIVPVSYTHLDVYKRQYVDSSNPDKSYGTDTLLKVAGSPAKIALIKFDLSPLADKEITSAQLKLQMAESSASTFTLRAVEDSSWDDTITYLSLIHI